MLALRCLGSSQSHHAVRASLLFDFSDGGGDSPILEAPLVCFLFLREKDEEGRSWAGRAGGRDHGTLWEEYRLLKIATKICVLCSVPRPGHCDTCLCSAHEVTAFPISP